MSRPQPALAASSTNVEMRAAFAINVSVVGTANDDGIAAPSLTNRPFTPNTAPRSSMHKAALRRYLRTWSPRYHPRNIELPRGVDVLLRRYSKLAKSAQA